MNNLYKQFRDTVLTNAGFQVSNKAASGRTQYKFTRAVSTDTDITGYKTEDLKNLSSLPDEISSGSIVDYDSDTDANVSVIRINFDNSQYKNGFGIRAVGLYAREEGSSNEFLHSVTVSDSEIIIPAVSGNVFDGFYLKMSVFTGDNKNISVNISDNNNATVKYVDKQDAAILKSANDYANDKISNIDLSKTIQQANDYADDKDRDNLQSAKKYADGKTHFYEDEESAKQSLNSAPNNSYVIVKGNDDNSSDDLNTDAVNKLIDNKFIFFDSINKAQQALSTAPNNSLIIAKGVFGTN